tara:strand:+ start:1616 stop:2041 length:426 start_codon:yes stop_codon:yes gene_type:complete
MESKEKVYIEELYGRKIRVFTPMVIHMQTHSRGQAVLGQPGSLALYDFVGNAQSLDKIYVGSVDMVLKVTHTLKRVLFVSALPSAKAPNSGTHEMQFQSQNEFQYISINKPKVYVQNIDCFNIDSNDYDSIVFTGYQVTFE